MNTLKRLNHARTARRARAKFDALELKGGNFRFPKTHAIRIPEQIRALTGRGKVVARRTIKRNARQPSIISKTLARSLAWAEKHVLISGIDHLPVAQ